MEKKYTPGPWGFDMAVDVFRLEGRETFAIYQHPEPGHTVEVVETPDVLGDDCIHGKDIAEKTANANLIAAAPELLEALEVMCRDCYRAMINPDSSLSDEYIAGQVGKHVKCDGCLTMAAIAKAHGKN